MRTAWLSTLGRVTREIWISWFERRRETAKLVDLLNHFGFANAGFKESDFTEPEQLIQLGSAPNRIDLRTSITGVTTDEALAGKVVAELDGIPVFILSKDTLIRNKRAVGRPQDIADLDMLES